MRIGYSILGLLYLAVDIALAGLALWALLDALLRPADDFALARQNKPFWVMALALAVLVTGNAVIPVLPVASGFTGSILFWVGLFAVLYYLSNERRAMGPGRLRWPFGRGGGSGRDSRGRW